MTESVFRHAHRVVYSECTVGNHVYYSRYPVIGVEIAYKGPARYDDLLTIELWITEMGGLRLNFGFRILNPAGGLLAEGVTRHICATTDEKPKRLPKEMIESLRPYLRSSP